jgi:hypothetical protein
MKQTTKTLVSAWLTAIKSGHTDAAEDRLGDIVRASDKKLLGAAYRGHVSRDMPARTRPPERGNARDHAFYLLCQWWYARQDGDRDRAGELIAGLDGAIIESPPYRADDPILDAVGRTWAESGLIYDS